MERQIKTFDQYLVNEEYRLFKGRKNIPGFNFNTGNYEDVPNKYDKKEPFFNKNKQKYWDKSDKLKPIKTVGGHRRYKLTDLEKFIGEYNTKTETNTNNLITAIYSRCSTSDQKSHGDLDRQSQRNLKYCVKHKYKVEHVIKDIGSGLNDKRTGFVKLCELVINKKKNKQGCY